MTGRRVIIGCVVMAILYCLEAIGAALMSVGFWLERCARADSRRVDSWMRRG